MGAIHLCQPKHSGQGPLSALDQTTLHTGLPAQEELAFLGRGFRVRKRLQGFQYDGGRSTRIQRLFSDRTLCRWLPLMCSRESVTTSLIRGAAKRNRRTMAVRQSLVTAAADEVTGRDHPRDFVLGIGFFIVGFEQPRALQSLGRVLACPLALDAESKELAQDFDFLIEVQFSLFRQVVPIHGFHDDLVYITE